MRTSTLWASLLVLTVGGCATCNSVLKGSPAAQPPTNVQVIANLQPAPDVWTTVAPVNGEFEIMPGARPTVGFRVSFQAPWPTAMKFTLDGARLVEMRDVAVGTDPAAVGFYRMVNVNVNTTPPTLLVQIRPPDSNLMSARSLSLQTVSINPGHDAGTADSESAPVVLTLGREKITTVTVMRTGTGTGVVKGFAPPSVLSCPPVCSAAYALNAPVVLQAHPTPTSNFVSWSGDCAASGTACSLTTSQAASAVTAEFRLKAVSSGPMCPTGSLDKADHQFVGFPDCATNDIAGHPAAFRKCDPQTGFYCCEPKTGANLSVARCGADHHEFPVDCMDHGIKAKLIDNVGCYVKD